MNVVTVFAKNTVKPETVSIKSHLKCSFRVRQACLRLYTAFISQDNFRLGLQHFFIEDILNVDRDVNLLLSMTELWYTGLI